MAKIPVDQSEGNASYKVLATASANQSFRNQITFLKNTLDTLADEEKMRCIFAYNNTVFRYGSPNYYSYIFTISTVYYVFTIDVSTASLYGASTTAATNATSITDYSTANDANPMYLMMPT